MTQKMKIHGGDVYGLARKTAIPAQQWLDFSANINPLGMPDGVRRAMLEAVEDAVYYPDPDCLRLREALAREHGIDRDWILCGNGGADLIFRIAYAESRLHAEQAQDRAWKAFVPAPTFLEYEQALKQERLLSVWR